MESAGLDELLHDAEVAHGHLCAGQILGVRMAMLALRRLGIGDPRRRLNTDGSLNPDRKRLVTFVEIDRCATDAIGVVTTIRVCESLRWRAPKGGRRSCIRSWRRTRSR
jgi:formylmethanofuran dehydrogenase subunit E